MQVDSGGSQEEDDFASFVSFYSANFHYQDSCFSDFEIFDDRSPRQSDGNMGNAGNGDVWPGGQASSHDAGLKARHQRKRPLDVSVLDEIVETGDYQIYALEKSFEPLNSVQLGIITADVGIGVDDVDQWITNALHNIVADGIVHPGSSSLVERTDDIVSAEETCGARSEVSDATCDPASHLEGGPGTSNPGLYLWKQEEGIGHLMTYRCL